MLFNHPRIFTQPELRGQILNQHAAIAEALAHQRQATENDCEARLRLRNR